MSICTIRLAPIISFYLAEMKCCRHLFYLESEMTVLRIRIDIQYNSHLLEFQIKLHVQFHASQTGWA